MSASAVMLALWSIPTMLAGILLIGFFASNQYWPWFPAGGLSQREALMMPFLPHWEHVSDVAMFGLFVLVGTAVFIFISRRASPLVRTSIMAFTGGFLGVVMATQVSDGLLLKIIMGNMLAFIFAVVGYTRYTALRVLFMGLIGLSLGVAAASAFQTGKFVPGFLLDRMWHLVLPILCLSY
ncbi:MAG TPA: ABC transporter permease, partial [Porticoccaceae bacterium]|nr:ABC transporter permease [Porticoccaceae bacterium]